MPKTVKELSNEQRLKNLIKELHPMEVVILVERLRTMADNTLAAIESKPSDFDVACFHHTDFERVMKKVKATFE